MVDRLLFYHLLKFHLYKNVRSNKIKNKKVATSYFIKKSIKIITAAVVKEILENEKFHRLYIDFSDHTARSAYL